jgi:hypothetical protein
MLIIGSCFSKQAKKYILRIVYKRKERHYKKLYYNSSKHVTRQNSSLIVKYKELL